MPTINRIDIKPDYTQHEHSGFKLKEKLPAHKFFTLDTLKQPSHAILSNALLRNNNNNNDEQQQQLQQKIKTQFNYLGVESADPIQYETQYASCLAEPDTLPDILKRLKAPPGERLAFRQDKLVELKSKSPEKLVSQLNKASNFFSHSKTLTPPPTSRTFSHVELENHVNEKFYSKIVPLVNLDTVSRGGGDDDAKTTTTTGSSSPSSISMIDQSGTLFPRNENLSFITTPPPVAAARSNSCTADNRTADSRTSNPRFLFKTGNGEDFFATPDNAVVSSDKKNNKFEQDKQSPSCYAKNISKSLASSELTQPDTIIEQILPRKNETQFARSTLDNRLLSLNYIERDNIIYPTKMNAELGQITYPNDAIASRSKLIADKSRLSSFYHQVPDRNGPILSKIEMTNAGHFSREHTNLAKLNNIFYHNNKNLPRDQAAKKESVRDVPKTINSFYREVPNSVGPPRQNFVSENTNASVYHMNQKSNTIFTHENNTSTSF